MAVATAGFVDAPRRFVLLLLRTVTVGFATLAVRRLPDSAKDLGRARTEVAGAPA